MHPYISQQLRNAVHDLGSLTKAKEEPTDGRAHRPGVVCPPRHDTAVYTAFGRVTDDTAPEHCPAVSVSLQHDTARCIATALKQLQDTARL